MSGRETKPNKRRRKPKEYRKLKKAKSRHFFQENKDTLMHVVEVVKADLKAADELLSNMIATSKLHFNGLSATAVNCSYNDA